MTAFARNVGAAIRQNTVPTKHQGKVEAARRFVLAKTKARGKGKGKAKASASVRARELPGTLAEAVKMGAHPATSVRTPVCQARCIGLPEICHLARGPKSRRGPCVRPLPESFWTPSGVETSIATCRMRFFSDCGGREGNVLCFRYQGNQ